MDEKQKPVTDAYRNASCWCACGRRFKADGAETCAECGGWTLGPSIHAHSVEEMVAGRFREGASCPDCPPPFLPRFKVVKVDEASRSISLELDESRS